MGNPIPITKSALRYHNAQAIFVRSTITNLDNLPSADMSVQQDLTHAEGLINEERARMFERAMATHILGTDVLQCHPEEILERLNANGSTRAGLSSFENLYRPATACSLTTMEAMLVLSPVNEPFALGSKIAMQQAGIAEASMESAEARTAAAKTSAALTSPSSQSRISVIAANGCVARRSG